MTGGSRRCLRSVSQSLDSRREKLNCSPTAALLPLYCRSNDAPQQHDERSWASDHCSAEVRRHSIAARQTLKNCLGRNYTIKCSTWNIVICAAIAQFKVAPRCHWRGQIRSRQSRGEMVAGYCFGDALDGNLFFKTSSI